MRHLATASLIAFAAAAVPLAAQDSAPSPGSFRLPTAPTPTPTDVQGPVDPDAPILTRPRAPTPTPTPRATSAPAPTPTPTAQPSARATPRQVLPPGSSTLPPRFTPPAAPTAEESAAVTTGDTPFPEAVPGTAPLPLPTAAPSPPPAVSTAPDSGDEGLPGWLFALVGALAALGIGATVFLRRRRGSAEVEAPVIERPPVGKPTAATPPPAPLAGPPLMIEAQAKQLARSMMFATLSYELRVTNRGPVPLENVSFGGDLVTAHARVPAEQQLADPATPLTPVQSLTRLDPGESASFAGDFRLPVSEIRPIPHGKAVVYVPLLRVRATAQGMEPIARTFIVGLKPPGSAGQRLQPFRLDEMPQTYRTVGQKALD
ncbi:hypothetical protein ACWPM1_05145 [Tsuneonella sp. HG249]